jgi:hypothetical protein
MRFPIPKECFTDSKRVVVAGGRWRCMVHHDSEDAACHWYQGDFTQACAECREQFLAELLYSLVNDLLFCFPLGKERERRLT